MMANEFVNEATDKAQAERYEMLKGKNLLWVSCHYAPGMYKALKPSIKGVVDLGVLLHVCVGNTEADMQLAKQMQEDGLTASVISANMADDNKACDNLYDAIHATGMKYDAVFSPHEVVQTIVGELSDRMNLPGNTKDAYIKARDKYLCRIACVEQNIPTPAYGSITTDNIDEMVEKIGLPLVLKPSSGSGSEGIYKCSTIEEVRSRVMQVTGDINRSMTISWSPGLDIVILAEEYVDGSEYDVDLLLWEGKVVYANVIDNWPTMEPTFLETASNCPSRDTPAVQKQLIDFSEQCVKALGFNQGAFHVECKYSMNAKRISTNEDGEVVGQPMLIEVNPRMGGGRTHMFHKNVFGVDLFDNFLMTACGVPINPPQVEKVLSCMGDYDVCATQTGILLHNRWLDHVRKHPLLLSCETYKQPGAFVKGADTGVPMWLGNVILKGQTLSEVIEAMENIISSFEIPIVPEDEKKPVTEAPAQIITDATEKPNTMQEASVAIEVA